MARGPGHRGAGTALAAVGYLLVHLACGGGNTTESPSPAEPPAPEARNLDFVLIPEIGDRSVVEFSWEGSDATSYRLEIGSSSGAADVGTIETNGTTYTWSGVPVGTFYARVTGLASGRVGQPSEEVLVGSIDQRLLIDALVFAFGPLAVQNYWGRPVTGPLQDRMLGWPPGTGFGVVLSESLPDDFVASAEKTVQQIEPATLGAVQAGIAGRQPDPLPRQPGSGQVTISMLEIAEMRDRCRCQSCVGCAATWYQGPFAQRAEILVSNQTEADTIAHELGHVVGLAHVIVAAGVRPPFSMGFTTDGQYSPRDQLDVLDPATIRMLETIYGMGLTAGTNRTDFLKAGLVIPERELAALAATRRDVPPGYEVREDGLETVIWKPVCQLGP